MVRACIALAALAQAVHGHGGGSMGSLSAVNKYYETLFPFGPAGNAILATAYISGPPNFLLGFMPPHIDPASLSVLVSFAVGGLLGDVFLHLLPQIFVGETLNHSQPRSVVVDDHGNTVLGLGIFGGLLISFLLDKTMRICSAGGHAHSHSHSHSHDAATTTARKEPDAVRRRGGAKESRDDGTYENGSHDSGSRGVDTVATSTRLSAYLNLIADFTHNITDGLAITASFYVSRNVGATTCLAVFFHEIPHEVGDFALLIQGGFSKAKAMQAQFVTAIGAFMGTFIGIGINYMTQASGGPSAGVPVKGGIAGTSVGYGDLVLPFTAGGFLYIATVGVIPDILDSASELPQYGRFKHAACQLVAMLLGIGLMFAISWCE